MKLILLMIIALLFFSCGSESSSNTLEPQVSNELELKDEKIINASPSDNKKSAITEKKENQQKIIQKYGEQLDFCSCIHFHDSLNNAAQKDLTEQQIDKLLSRWEQIEVKCKELVNTEHRTPEERLAHERRVQKCLN